MYWPFFTAVRSALNLFASTSAQGAVRPPAVWRCAPAHNGGLDQRGCTARTRACARSVASTGLCKTVVPVASNSLRRWGAVSPVTTIGQAGAQGAQAIDDFDAVFFAQPVVHHQRVHGVSVGEQARRLGAAGRTQRDPAELVQIGAQGGHHLGFIIDHQHRQRVAPLTLQRRAGGLAGHRFQQRRRSLWQTQLEARAMRHNLDEAQVEPDQRCRAPHDRQPEPEPLGAVARRVADLEELFEHTLAVRRRDARPGVRYGHQQLPRRLGRQRQSDATCGRELDRVVNQVGQDAHELVLIGQAPGRGQVDVGLQVQAALRGESGKFVAQNAQHAADVARPDAAHRTGIEARDVEQRVEQPLALRQRAADVAADVRQPRIAGALASSSSVVALIDNACSGWRRSWLAAAKKRVRDADAASARSRSAASDAASRSRSSARRTSASHECRCWLHGRSTPAERGASEMKGEAIAQHAAVPEPAGHEHCRRRQRHADVSAAIPEHEITVAPPSLVRSSEMPSLVSMLVPKKNCGNSAACRTPAIQ